MVPLLWAKLPEFLLGPGVVVIQVCMGLPVKDVGPGPINPPWKAGLLVVVGQAVSLPSFAIHGL